MTNEEAIKFLSQIMDAILVSNSWLPSTDNPIKESFGMAINALTAQPETHEKRTETHGVCLDTIDRQAALDWLKNEWNGMVTSLFDGIKALPSAESEIIRCKDCAHWMPHCQLGFDIDNEEYHDYCGRLIPEDEYYAFYRNADDYCSRAERRTDG